MKNKVYCLDCDYYVLDYGYYPAYCRNHIGEEDTPLKRQVVYAVFEVQNKHNDCVYYEEKTVSFLAKIFKKIW